MQRFTHLFSRSNDKSRETRLRQLRRKQNAKSLGVESLEGRNLLAMLRYPIATDSSVSNTLHASASAMGPPSKFLTEK